ncbi:hypothetical protein FRB95_006115 [Tulasnella sp. JGI-2019a]|nr:hypothetical protein FRB95_006115 [Tulasnella sp. JGI-2019a]
MFAQTLAVSLFAFPVVFAGKTIDVFVGGNNGLVFKPDSVTADVGDTVLFTFGSLNHTMTQSTFDVPCTGKPGGLFSGYMPVPLTQSEGFPQFPVPIKDLNPFWAFCSQGNHCQKGMVFAVNAPTTGDNTFDAFRSRATASSVNSSAVVAAAPEATTTTNTTSDASIGAVGTYNATRGYEADPSMPVTTNAAGTVAPVVHTVVVGGSAGLVYTPNTITAAPGDIVTFQFQVKNHTVTQSTFAVPCSEKAGGFDSSFMPVAATDMTFPTYNITVNDTAPIWGYCRQANHCASGMVFAINPPATGNTFAAFKSMAMNGTTAKSASASAYGSGAVDGLDVKLPLMTFMMISLGFALVF